MLRRTSLLLPALFVLLGGAACPPAGDGPAAAPDAGEAPPAALPSVPGGPAPEAPEHGYPEAGTMRRALEDDAGAVPAADPDASAGPSRPAPDAAGEAAPGPRSDLPIRGGSGAPGIRFDPRQPAAGQAVALRAGPITFRNGCEGIADTSVRRSRREVRVSWTPREVPTGAMCTQALHDEWVEATLTGLEPGTYAVKVDGVGEATLTVGAAAP